MFYYNPKKTACQVGILPSIFFNLSTFLVNYAVDAENAPDVLQKSKRYDILKKKGVYTVKLILCLDDRDGMAFGGRRQSRDAAMLADLSKLVREGAVLRATPYSQKLLSEAGIPARISEFPELDAADGDLCWLETRAPLEGVRIDALILYRWNRHYPADLSFDVASTGFCPASREELVGKSHPKITKEVWIK